MNTKLIRDLEETEDLYALYRQASRLTSDAILRGSQTIRAMLARMDRYVTDLP